MEILSWFLVERDAPEWLRDASQASYVNNFGPGGVFEQDDAEAWKAITESVQGPFAGEGLLNYEMGMDLTPLTDWPGPGEALPSGYAEQNQRRFWGDGWNTWVSLPHSAGVLDEASAQAMREVRPFTNRRRVSAVKAGTAGSQLSLPPPRESVRRSPCGGAAKVGAVSWPTPTARASMRPCMNWPSPARRFAASPATFASAMLQTVSSNGR